jgi:hypothetical protein
MPGSGFWAFGIKMPGLGERGWKVNLGVRKVEEKTIKVFFMIKPDSI